MDLITTTTRSEYGITVEVTNGKQTAQIFIPGGRDRFSQLCVLCKNASHRAWKGWGRFFDTFEQARDGYRSSFMRAAIEAAREYA